MTLTSTCRMNFLLSSSYLLDVALEFKFSPKEVEFMLVIVLCLLVALWLLKGEENQLFLDDLSISITAAASCVVRSFIVQTLSFCSSGRCIFFRVVAVHLPFGLGFGLFHLNGTMRRSTTTMKTTKETHIIPTDWSEASTFLFGRF